MNELQSLVVRKVSETDVDEMVMHRINYLTEMYGKYEPIQEKKLHSELREYILSGIKNDSFVAFVAEVGGKSVSYGAMVFRTVPGDFKVSTYLEGDILNMYTIPEARKQGISTIVLEKLIAEARSKGVAKLSLHTTEAGEKLYRSAGFSEPVFPYLELVL
jgi:ribosomal protein S18 acetylase RimI-like enzyme